MVLSVSASLLNLKLHDPKVLLTAEWLYPFEVGLTCGQEPAAPCWENSSSSRALPLAGRSILLLFESFEERVLFERVVSEFGSLISDATLW